MSNETLAPPFLGDKMAERRSFPTAITLVEECAAFTIFFVLVAFFRTWPFLNAGGWW